MHRILHTLLCVGAALAISVSGGCGGATSRFANYMQRGEQYLSSGVLDKAGVEFRNALQIEPRNPKARYLNGVVAEKRGDLRGAFGAYEGAIDVDPDYVDARAALGRMLVFSRSADKALTVIEPSLQKHPGDARLLTVRAAARAQMKNTSGALADAEQAVRAEPQDTDAVALLAALYQSQGDTPRAIKLVNATLDRRPSSVDLRQVLANLYLSAHQDDKCEEQLRKIIALEPQDLGHRYELARFYQHSGRMDAAQGVFEGAVRAAPAKSEPKLALTEFIANQRSREQGEKTLRAFIAADPKDDQLRLGLAVLLQRSGAAAEALETYKAVVSRDGRSAASLTARNRMAAIEIAQGDAAAAAPLVAAVLEQSPRDTDALLMRADIALRDGKPQPAIVDLRAVLRDQPNSSQIQYALAQAYLQNGEKALAEETLRTAIQASPSTVAPRLELARLLTQSDHLDDAVVFLEESVRQLPRDAEIRQALVRAYLAKGDLAAARTAAEDLKTLEPASAAGPYLAGLVAQRENHNEEARTEFERALQLQPAGADALVALTRLQLAHGQSAAAVVRLRALVKADPQNPFAQNLLGETLIASGAYAEAAAQLTQTVQLAPKWSLPYHNLALAHRDNHEPQAAEQAYQAGLKEIPFDPVLTADLAEVFEQRGDVDRAIALYEGLNAHDPRLALARNNLAMLLVNYRSDRASLDRARALTEEFATSDSGALLDTHGWVRLKLGEVNDALAVLTRAADRAPDSRVIHYHLAMAELRAGKRDKARADLESALAGSARFTGSDDAKAALNSLAGSRS